MKKDGNKSVVIRIAVITIILLLLFSNTILPLSPESRSAVQMVKNNLLNIFKNLFGISSMPKFIGACVVFLVMYLISSLLQLLFDKITMKDIIYFIIIWVLLMKVIF